MRLLFISVLFISLFSCNNNAEVDEQPLQKTEEPEDTVTDEQAFIMYTTFPDLFGFFAAQDSSFTLSGFDVSVTSPLDSVSGVLDEAHLSPYYPYFIYSRDSSKAIDLYSYNYVLVKQGGKTAASYGEPDTEVAVVDFREKMRRRIFFGGPSAAIFDARWLNDTTVLLAGAEIAGDKKTIPFISQIFLPSLQRETYYYNDTLAVDVRSYRDKRLYPEGAL